MQGNTALERGALASYFQCTNYLEAAIQITGFCYANVVLGELVNLVPKCR